MTLQLPRETPGSAARRRELYSVWESETSVARRIPNLRALLRDGRALSVWVREEGEYRCPDFQFDGQGQLIPQMKRVLDLLRGPNGLADANSQTGWLEVEWLHSPHALLNAKSPAECFPTDPDAVLVAADEEFSQHRSRNW